MKRITLFLTACLFVSTLQAQYTGYPILYTWVRNLTGAVGYNNIPSNVQSLKYDASNVYVAADCIPGYDIGPWASNPNTPSNQNFVYKITRNPAHNTGTLTSIGLGHTGVWSNGVSVYNVSDAMSYNNAGVWNRNAYYFEGISFDSCLGHPAPNGEYHNHVNPICLYDESDSTRHSPIIGYAFDGYPIYGTFGYANANGTGGIKRITSSYVVSTATTRTNGPAVSSTYPEGCFLEDWKFTAGEGDLDSLNGRFCVTPEYPNGTYCYYATLGPGEKPTFPYTMYKNYYGIVQSGNTNNGGHNTAPGSDTSYTATYVPTITISTGSNTVCAGSTVTFTASITNGGPKPLYDWYKNSTLVSTDSFYTTGSLNNHDTIKCLLTSDAYYLTSNTATSNKIVITVNPVVTPSVTVGASQTTICAGTNINFTATPVNGGTASYQWVKNGTNVGSNSATYANSALNNNDSVWVVMTSTASCASPATATSGKVHITVSGSVTPVVTVNANQTAICAGTGVTFTATPLNGGSTPVYQWKKNGNNVGTNSPGYYDTGLHDNDSVWAVMTSSSSCASPATATGNAVIMSVTTNVVPSITISASPGDTICSGTLVSFTANAVNGGSSPGYQWTYNGNQVSIGAVYTSNTLSNGDVISCSLTSNANCASPVSVSSNSFAMTVNPIPAMPTISRQGNVLSSNALTGNQWLLNDVSINGAINQTYTATTTGWYSVIVTSNAGCPSPADSIFVVPTGIMELGVGNDVNVFPNPFGAQFTIQINGPVTDFTGLRYAITDYLGRTVFENPITGYTNAVKMEHVTAGIYLLNIYKDNERATFKLIKTE